MKNHINQTLAFTFLLLILLTGASLLPKGLSLFRLQFREIDILSEIRFKHSSDTPDNNRSLGSTSNDPQDVLLIPATTSNSSPIITPLPTIDTSFFGKIIEDYTPEKKGLYSFFTAIDAIKQGRTVRVAWYGDSFVEGDVILGDLRDTLQTRWGGRGVGFLPITSEVAHFRRTIRQQFSHWNTFSIVKKTEFHPKFGLNGYAYQPQENATLTYEGTRYFRNSHHWTEARLFYTASAPCDFEWQLADRIIQNDHLTLQNNQVNLWEWKGNKPGSKYLNLRFNEKNDLTLYGAALESGPGFYLDNFSVRGNSGGSLKLLNPSFIQQFNAFQHYDLIVLQVGLNAVTNSLSNIQWYQEELDGTFKHLRACFPNQPILIISVGDRGGKIGTELETMPSVPAIVAMQREMAQRHGLLFYDLFHGMGGKGTMVRFAMQYPRLANTDYTHLTHEGGQVVGLRLAGIFLEEQKKWISNNLSR